MWRRSGLAAFVASFLALGAGGEGAEGESVPDGGSNKLYVIREGKVDARTYNGFRRYHAGCNHCHGPDGIGSTFAPSLVAPLADADAFRRIVLEGSIGGASAMPGYACDPNFAPRVDDIYAHLQARADGRLPRGRPAQLAE
jgi:mono/diheme cytochrome c family protein